MPALKLNKLLAVMVLIMLFDIQAQNWSYYPSRTDFGKRQRSTFLLSIPPGRESLCGFARNIVNCDVPAGVPFKAGYWSRSKNLAPAPGKNMRIGMTATLVGESGKKYYMGLSPVRSESWRWTQQINTFPEGVRQVSQLYLMAYNLSGSIEYDEVFFAPWTEKEALADAAPFLRIPVGDHAGGFPGEARETALISGFRKLKDHSPASNATELFLTADRENLYIMVNACSELLKPELQQLDRFKAAITEENGPVFNDDSVEIFIESPDGGYFHIACNALGTKYFGRNSGEAPAGDWQVEAGRHNGFWRAEIRIPWRKLGYPAMPERNLRFNAGRNDCMYSEYSSWSLLKTGFHDFERFGTVSLGGKTAQIVPEEPLPLQLAPGRSSFGYRIRGGMAAGLKLDQQIFAGNGGWRLVEEVSASPDRDRAVRLEADFPEAGKYQVRYRLLDHAGNILYRSPLLEVTSRPALKAVSELRLPGGSVELSVNGRKVETDEISLGRGENVITIKAEGNGELQGGIRINGNHKIQSEMFRITGTVNGTAEMVRKIRIGQTSVGSLDLSTGLHLEKGGAQHFPLIIAAPQKRHVELLLPSEVKLSASQAGILEDEPRGPYHFYRFTVDRPAGTTAYTLGMVLHLPEDAPDRLPPLYFRTNGADTMEVWNPVEWKILPALNAGSPRSIRLEIGHSFSVGAYGEAEAALLLRSMKQAGINTYWERTACYGTSLWLDAARRNLLRANLEFHAKAILGTGKPAINLKGGNPHHLAQPIGYLLGEGREKTFAKIKDFAAKFQPEEVVVDLEYPPDGEFDASPETLKRFAESAGLPQVPKREEIPEKFRKQWVEFCCREIAALGGLIREGLKAGHPAVILN